eukprot:6195751-Pleurochrysis_carterae.AAC.1
MIYPLGPSAAERYSKVSRVTPEACTNLACVQTLPTRTQLQLDRTPQVGLQSVTNESDEHGHDGFFALVTARCSSPWFAIPAPLPRTGSPRSTHMR